MPSITMPFASGRGLPCPSAQMIAHAPALARAARCVSVLVVVLATGAPAIAEAQAPAAAPQAGAAAAPVISRFADWELICPQDNPGQGCRVSQLLGVNGSGETVFGLNVLAARQAGQQVAIISTPLGGYLAPGMELRIDRARPVRVLYETCNVSGCHGGFALAGAIRRGLTSGRRLQVRLWTAKNQPVDVNVSLNGFAQAVQAMEARAAAVRRGTPAPNAAAPATSAPNARGTP